MKKLFVILGMCAASIFMTAQAQDTITFTWKGGVNKRFVIMTATTSKQVTVHWGDSSIEKIKINDWILQNINHTYADTNDYTASIIGNDANDLFFYFICTFNQLSNLDLSKNTALYSLDCSNNQLSALDVSKNVALKSLTCSNNQLSVLDIDNNTALISLDCSDNQLNSLDLSGCTALTSIFCYNNQLNSLDLSKIIKLEYVYCYNNQLSLSELYAISLRVPSTEMYYTNKLLGSQFLPVQQTVVGDTVDFSSEAKYKDTHTAFVVVKDSIRGTRSIIDIDYTIDSGIIVFNNAGRYFVIMTNYAIRSYYEYPATVFAEFDVRDLNTDATLSNLTVSKGKLTPTFHNDTLNYIVNVPYSTTEINIIAITTDTNATVSGNTGLQQLVVGKNIFTIKVTAEDKATMQNYTITVNRADTMIDSTGIREITQEHIKIYPNPTSGKLRIENGELMIENVELFDVYGKSILRHCERSEAIQKIDISHLANGMYYLKIGKKIVKVIKE